MERSRLFKDKQRDASVEIIKSIAALERDGEISKGEARMLRFRAAKLAKLATYWQLENGTLGDDWAPRLHNSVRSLARAIRFRAMRYGKREVIERWDRKVLDQEALRSKRVKAPSGSTTLKLPCCSDFPFWPLCDEDC